MYLLISLPFVLVAAAVWWIRRHSVPGQCTVTAVVVVPLVALTVTFDDLMIRVGLVGYDPAHHTGLAIGGDAGGGSGVRGCRGSGRTRGLAEWG